MSENNKYPKVKGVNRRQFLSLGMGIVSAAGIGVVANPGESKAWADVALTEDGLASDARARRNGSVNRAYDYLSFAMDAYQDGRTQRLVQSFADSQQLGSTAFVYDNSLAILAYLERGKRDDVARAMLLGDSFLYAQAHDPTYTDGRVRQAYWVGPFTLPFTSNDSYFVRANGSVNLVGAPWFFQGSSVSDMSWVAIALARLYARTGKSPYLRGSLRLGQWIVNNAFDTAGLGGYSAGVDGNNNRLNLTKLTEHNIDVYGLFTNLLAPLTGDAEWTRLGQHALDFIALVWNAEGGFFYTGSSDGVTIDTDVVLEEVQAQGYLSLLDRRYDDALDWTKTNLIGTDTPQSLNPALTGNLRLSGVSFSNVSRHATERANPSDPLPDPDAVWFEGTAHMVAALLARRLRAREDLATFDGDVATASEYSGQIILAQTELGRGQVVNGLVIPDRSGVVAASSVLNTGTGFSYYPNVHLAATSWYLIAASAGNPYRL
ncbi:MAG: hypothetical protein WA854_02185 [Candidatus Binataceae bacterium]